MVVVVEEVVTMVMVVAAIDAAASAGGGGGGGGSSAAGAPGGRYCILITNTRCASTQAAGHGLKIDAVRWGSATAAVSTTTALSRAELLKRSIFFEPTAVPFDHGKVVTSTAVLR